MTCTEEQFYGTVSSWVKQALREIYLKDVTVMNIVDCL